MNIVIVGDGKVGATLVEHLSTEGHDVVVIDRDQKIVEQMVNSFDVMGICGNGANCEVQLEAGVQSADLFIAATSSDELNILSCLMAKKVGTQHTVARVRNPDYLKQTPFFKDELGLSLIVNPEFDAANEIAKVLRFPNATNIETFYRGLVDLAEIKLDVLYTIEKRKTTYKPLPKFPATTRDLSLICDDEIPVAKIEKAIKNAVGSILEKVTLFDVYKGKQIEEGKKSVSYSISMRSHDGTLTDELIQRLIRHSYNEVVKKMPRRTREELHIALIP